MSNLLLVHSLFALLSYRVAASSASNRMPASNLAIVWGPCLLAANVINFDIARMNMLAKVLIENYERIFRPANERLVC